MMPRIEVEFNIVNILDDSEAVDHFTYEEEGTLTLHLILLFLFAPLFFLAIYRCSQHQKLYHTQHSPFFIIILALFF
jgi:Rhodopsin-like GPCR transmembrane domain